MKGLSILYAGLLAFLTRSAISAATIPQSPNISSTAIELENGHKINEIYTLNNTTNLKSSNITYTN